MSGSATAFGVPSSGVLTIHGYGVSARVERGHLLITDGVGRERRQFRLPRVGHGLKRLVCIGHDGFISLSALRWLSDVGAFFIMLDRLGKVRVVTGPASSSEARLRRAQALALGNGTALRISRTLISAKLTGQARLLREKLHNDVAADFVIRLQNPLNEVDSLDAIRSIESRAAAEYWSAWREVPILFPRKDLRRIPTHWLRFGSRHSPLTGGPRLSVNPANSLLNYVNAIAESECTLAISACGLDAGVGFLHTDTANRPSLSLDLIETIRPAIEEWLLDWLLREPLRRSDFFEAPNGNCRITAHLCAKLSESAPTWATLIAQWAEYVVRELWATTPRRSSRCDLSPTRLTQRRKTEARGIEFIPATATAPKPDRVCHDCGAPAPHGQRCSKCGRELASQTMTELAKTGRVAAQGFDAQQKRSETQVRHKAAERAWRLKSKDSPISEEVYQKEIQPRLASATISAIASMLQISIPYAADIRAGRRRPHPRHWQALAKLVVVSG